MALAGFARRGLEAHARGVVGEAALEQFGCGLLGKLRGSFDAKICDGFEAIRGGEETVKKTSPTEARVLSVGSPSAVIVETSAGAGKLTRARQPAVPVVVQREPPLSVASVMVTPSANAGLPSPDSTQPTCVAAAHWQMQIWSKSVRLPDCCGPASPTRVSPATSARRLGPRLMRRQTALQPVMPRLVCGEATRV